MAIGYGLVRTLARWVLEVFYRRIEIVGIEHLPEGGPLIVAANHQNALVDPMLLLGLVPRPMVPVAKAPLFRHPVIGPFLRMVGALPVLRRQEGNVDPARNRETFAAASAHLAAGGAVLIFPEGTSQPEPTLMPLRSGAARMLLEAEATARSASLSYPSGSSTTSREHFARGVRYSRSVSPSPPETVSRSTETSLTARRIA